MTNMAATLQYGIKKTLFGTKTPMTLRPGMLPKELGPIIVSSNDDIGLTLTYYQQDQISSPMLLNGENELVSYIKETVLKL